MLRGAEPWRDMIWRGWRCSKGLRWSWGNAAVYTHQLKRVGIISFVQGIFRAFLTAISLLHRLQPWCGQVDLRIYNSGCWNFVFFRVSSEIHHFRPFGRSPKIAMWPHLKRLVRDPCGYGRYSNLSGPFRRWSLKMPSQRYFVYVLLLCGLFSWM